MVRDIGSKAATLNHTRLSKMNKMSDPKRLFHWQHLEIDKDDHKRHVITMVFDVG